MTCPKRHTPRPRFFLLIYLEVKVEVDLLIYCGSGLKAKNFDRQKKIMNRRVKYLGKLVDKETFLGPWPVLCQYSAQFENLLESGNCKSSRKIAENCHFGPKFEQK